MEYVVQMYASQIDKFVDMATFPYLEPAKVFVDQELAKGTNPGEYIVVRKTVNFTRVY